MAENIASLLQVFVAINFAARIPPGEKIKNGGIVGAHRRDGANPPPPFMLHKPCGYRYDYSDD